MAYCCMNDFAGMTANFTTPHFSADLPYWTKPRQLKVKRADNPIPDRLQLRIPLPDHPIYDFPRGDLRFHSIRK